MSSHYVEIAVGGPRHQSTCVQKSKLLDRMTECIKMKQELYKSVFTFDDRIQDHLRTRKSASGFIGNMTLDSIIFDIDRSKNTDALTLHRAIVFVEGLFDTWKLQEDWVQIWFSGTGYHIQIPEIFGFTSTPDLDQVVKATLDTYFPEADTVFYHKAGLIRVGYTINSKSGLYKTPLSWEELKTLSVEDIKQLASTPRLDVKFKKQIVEPMYQDLICNEVRTDNKLVVSLDSPSKVVTCVQAMYKVGEELGTRHERIMAMVSSWRRSGIPLSGVIDMIKSYAPSMDQYEIEKHCSDIYKKGYQFGCEHKTMKQFCSSSCIYYANKDYSADIVSGKDMEKQMVKFARTDFRNRGINLQDIWQIDKPFWIYPGYYVNTIGDTGLNKTALMQNIAIAIPQFSPILYLSTEFSNLLLFRRFTQIAHDMTKDQVLEHYQTHENHLSNAFDHIHYLKTTPNLGEIQKLVARFNPKIVIIDTIDDINVSGLKGLEAEQKLAQGLKQLAENQETIIMCVHHIRKDGAETTDKEGVSKAKVLSMRDGKGSGSFNQKADVVIAIEGDRTKTQRRVSILKGRDDSPFKIAFNVDMDTFKFNQIIL
ncbi:MAG: AAA family ATPase [Ignavibacteriaceae bacterium]|nr:AAA family ATPase [Ignavibacteriaceae bacterium]